MNNRRVTRARSNLSSSQQTLRQPNGVFSSFVLAQSQVERWPSGSARTEMDRHRWYRRPLVAQRPSPQPNQGWLGNWRRSYRSRNLHWGASIRRNPFLQANSANSPSQTAVPMPNISDAFEASPPSSPTVINLSESMEEVDDSSMTVNFPRRSDDPEVQSVAAQGFTNLAFHPRDGLEASSLDVPSMADVIDSQADFQATTSVKKSHNNRRVSEEKKNLDDTRDESELCTICYEPWTTSGRHRLVCLKCGHLYGQECIEKWLDTQGKGSCPQCNAKASRKDIRCLYIRRLIAVDNSELERVKKELEEEKVARKRAEMDLGLMRLRWQQLEDRCGLLKRELDEQREQNLMATKQTEATLPSKATRCSGSYQFEKIFPIEVGGCRALAYNPVKMHLCASQASPSALYPGFGIRKICTHDFRTTQYIPLHAKQIRGLSFHPLHDRSLLLSCSMDKMVKITSMESLETVQSFTCASHAWSCTWNGDDANYFYVGTQSGEVLLFDVRNTRDHVAALLSQIPDSKSVVSLGHVPRSTSDSPGPGGLLVGQLDRSLFLEANGSLNHFTHYLSNDSVLMSLHREEATGHVLASYRPTPHKPHVRHEVNDLVLAPKAPTMGVPPMQQPSSYYERVSYDRVRTFRGGTSQQTLMKTSLLAHPELGSEQLFVCAGDGSSNKLFLWNVSTGSLQQQLIGPEQGVLDVCPITLDGSPVILSAVGNKHLYIYRWKE